MSCSEHNVSACLICAQTCTHGPSEFCARCDPFGTLTVAKLKACLSAERQRANKLGDELGAMRSDRDSAYVELRQMREAFERQSRLLAKAPKPTLPRR